MLNETMKLEILKMFPEIGTLTNKLKPMSKEDRLYYIELIFDSVIINARLADGEILAALSRWSHKINQAIDKAQEDKKKNL